MQSTMNEHEYVYKSCKRAARRKKDVSKAIRKARLSRILYGHDWYKHLHQYSKNKIHCSCNLCRFRPVWNPDEKPYSDVKKLVNVEEQLK